MQVEVTFEKTKKAKELFKKIEHRHGDDFDSGRLLVDTSEGGDGRLMMFFDAWFVGCAYTNRLKEPAFQVYGARGQHEALPLSLVYSLVAKD